MAQTVKSLPATQETWVWSLGREYPLEKEMTTHSSTLAWKLPWTEDPGRIQSMRSQRVGHDWVTSLEPVRTSPVKLVSFCFISSPGYICTGCSVIVELKLWLPWSLLIHGSGFTSGSTSAWCLDFDRADTGPQAASMPMSLLPEPGFRRVEGRKIKGN